MNQRECMISNWQAIGFEDGSRGYTAEQFSRHRKACARFGVSPDFQAYQAGRAEGLVEYCKPNRGYRLGAQGKPYRGVCPANLEADFLTAYRAGKRLHSMEKDIQSLDKQIHHREKELSATEETLATTSEQLINGDASPQTRELLLAETLKLSKRLEEIDMEILRLQREKNQLQLQLANYRQSFARFTY